MKSSARVFGSILPAVLSAGILSGQVVDGVQAPLRNWAAPLYWQPLAEATPALELQPQIREFAPHSAPGTAALVFVAMTPCRVVDTRASQGFTGAFGPPSLSAYPSSIRTFPMQASANCAIPATAQAYSLNVTIIPNPIGSPVGYVTIYPTAAPPNAPPNFVTLDDVSGDIRNNAAIVPAGITGGSISVVTNGTGPDLVIDINGYYTQATGVTLAQGTASAPSLSFSGDPTTGIFSSGTGALNLATGGINRLTVRSDGDIDLTGNIRKNAVPFLHNLGGTSVGVGFFALTSNTGDDNTAGGDHALNGNTAFGSGALQSNVTGNSNTAIGAFAGKLITGSNNTVVGAHAGSAGTGNTALGSASLSSVTGDYNTAAGYSAGSAITTGTYNIDIGNQGKSADDRTIRIGDSANQTSFFAAGIAGVAVSNQAAVMIDTTTGQLGTVSSSRRYKEDITDMNEASAGLLQLRPVTFRYHKPNPDGSKPLDYGLIAEEVAEVYPNLVARNAAGEVETVQYHKLTPMLLNEVQREHRAVQTDEETIRGLQTQLAVLQEILDSLSAKKFAAGTAQ